MPEEDKLLKRYDVVPVGDLEKLIYPVKEGGTAIKFYLHNDDIYHAIHEAHGGRNRMEKEL